MEKVWIVFGIDSYDGMDVVEVCSTREIAEKLINVCKTEGAYDICGSDYLEYKIREYEVNGRVNEYKDKLKESINKLSDLERLLP